MDQLLRAHGADGRSMAKVGEGSYGEAFRHGSSVFKIVPIDGEQVGQRVVVRACVGTEERVDAPEHIMTDWTPVVSVCAATCIRYQVNLYSHLYNSMLPPPT